MLLLVGLRAGCSAPTRSRVLIAVFAAALLLGAISGGLGSSPLLALTLALLVPAAVIGWRVGAPYSATWLAGLALLHGHLHAGEFAGAGLASGYALGYAASSAALVLLALLAGRRIGAAYPATELPHTLTAALSGLILGGALLG